MADLRPTDSPHAIHALAGHSAPLDGLRGLSLLAIIAVHCTHAAGFGTSTLALDQWMHKLVAGLWISVDLFFALSGYLITSIILAAKGLPGTMYAFYARRILRIFPLFYVYLTTIHFVLPALGINLLPTDYQGKWPWHFLFGTNVLTAIDGVQHRVIAHFWTLAAEEQFYLVWPWIVNFLPRRWTMGVCVAALATSSFLRSYLLTAYPDMSVSIYVLPPLRWDALVFGSLAALVSYDPSLLLRNRTLWKWILIVCCSLTLILGVPQTDLTNWGGLSVAVGFLFLAGWFSSTIALCVAPRKSRLHGTPHHPAHPRRHPIIYLLSWWPFCWVGKVSYAAYIFHTPVIQILTVEGSLYPALTPAADRAAFFPFILCYLATCGLTLLLAAVSWHYFEGPINDLKDRFPYGRHPIEPVPAPATIDPVSESTPSTVVPAGNDSAPASQSTSEQSTASNP